MIRRFRTISFIVEFGFIVTIFPDAAASNQCADFYRSGKEDVSGASG
jgi:hypothetical protein